MRVLIAASGALLCLPVVVALGQSPADGLRGTWVAETTFCGKAIYKIDSVDVNGIVHGSFTCANTKWSPTLGDVINKNAVKGTLNGNHFVMVNFDGGGNDLMLNGNKLEGTGTVKAGSPKNPATFIKQ